MTEGTDKRKDLSRYIALTEFRFEQFALPLALAVQPQTMTLPAEKLEPEFQNRSDSKGTRITHVFANKGL